MNQSIYSDYVSILNEELVCALGCTEPIAIAYAAAKAREVLGVFPDTAQIQCSGNIIKNAMGVVVPGAGGLKGIQASVMAGIVGGRADRELEVLSSLTPDDTQAIKSYVDADFCSVMQLETDASLHIIVHLEGGSNSASVEILHSHTNIYRILKDGALLFESVIDSSKHLGTMTDRSVLNVEDIVEFADSVELEDIQEIISNQIECNMAIAHEGMEGSYGVHIGQAILSGMGDSIWTTIKAYTGAASEARMSGSIMPVVTNSGSGNQGITVSVPVIIYARETGVSPENLTRALVLSNLLAIHLKTKIGRLSAFCGAVSAACAVGAGITYLADGSVEAVSRTMVNTLANIPGIVCDGAKPSCAAKIASSLDASIMAHLLSMNGESYEAGTGILKSDIEKTISSIGSMACNGMATTDIEILRIMLDQS